MEIITFLFFIAGWFLMDCREEEWDLVGVKGKGNWKGEKDGWTEDRWCMD